MCSIEQGEYYNSYFGYLASDLKIHFVTRYLSHKELVVLECTEKMWTEETLHELMWKKITLSEKYFPWSTPVFDGIKYILASSKRKLEHYVETCTWKDAFSYINVLFCMDTLQSQKKHALEGLKLLQSTPITNILFKLLLMSKTTTFVKSIRWNRSEKFTLPSHLRKDILDICVTNPTSDIAKNLVLLYNSSLESKGFCEKIVQAMVKLGNMDCWLPLIENCFQKKVLDNNLTDMIKIIGLPKALAALEKEYGIDEYNNKNEGLLPERMINLFYHPQSLHQVNLFLIQQMIHQTWFELALHLDNFYNNWVVKCIDEMPQEKDRIDTLITTVSNTFNNYTETPNARILSAYIMLRYSIEPDEYILKSIDGYPTPLPDIISQPLRKSIISYWGMNHISITNICWTLEAYFENKYKKIQKYHPPFIQIKESMRSIGLDFLGPIDAKDYFRANVYMLNKDANFFIMAIKCVNISPSTREKIFKPPGTHFIILFSNVGPYAMIERGNIKDQRLISNDEPNVTDTQIVENVKEVLERMNISVLSDDVLEVPLAMIGGKPISEIWKLLFHY